MHVLSLYVGLEPEENPLSENIQNFSQKDPKPSSWEAAVLTTIPEIFIDQNAIFSWTIMRMAASYFTFMIRCSLNWSTQNKRQIKDEEQRENNGRKDHWGECVVLGCINLHFVRCHNLTLLQLQCNTTTLRMYGTRRHGETQAFMWTFLCCDFQSSTLSLWYQFGLH